MSTDSKHSPEPWRFERTDHRGFSVVKTNDGRRYEFKEREDADRVCAAVNACANVPQAELETLNVAALRAAATGAQGALRQLKRQLDAAADRPLGEVLILAGGVYHYQVRTVLEALAAVLGEGGTAAAEGGGE
jgi:hypothetical protein